MTTLFLFPQANNLYVDLADQLAGRAEVRIQATAMEATASIDAMRGRRLAGNLAVSLPVTSTPRPSWRTHRRGVITFCL